jgi:hypothetical protein
MFITHLHGTRYDRGFPFADGGWINFERLDRLELGLVGTNQNLIMWLSSPLASDKSPTSQSNLAEILTVVTNEEDFSV